jgi:hypothetical protein
VVDHDLGLEPDRVVVALDVPPELLLASPFTTCAKSGHLAAADRPVRLGLTTASG